jgi:phage-related minor tail protein
MAAGIDRVVGTQGQAATALAEMAGTGAVAGENLQAFAQVAVQTQRTVGTSVADTAKVFEKLGDEPVKASLALNKSMNYLTAATFEQINAAKELGDSELAASLAQTAYATAMATRTEQIRGNLGTLEKAWLGVKDMAYSAWDTMLGLGRPTDPSKQLDNLSKAIADTRSKLADKGLTANWGGEEKLQGELKVLL